MTAEITADLPGGATMEFVWIEAGTFTMGTSGSRAGRGATGAPQHTVTITHGFYLGKYVVTQGQWQAVMGTTPWVGRRFVQAGPDRPAACISWEDVCQLIARLNTAADEACYRLPTEAEWEYACRAGTTTPWSFGAGDSRLGQYGWYSANAWDRGLQHAQPVGDKPANPWGLHDMHGNVLEWVQDWDGPYGRGTSTDPSGPEAGSTRILRGGSFLSHARDTTSAGRDRAVPGEQGDSVGVRLLRTG